MAELMVVFSFSQGTVRNRAKVASEDIETDADRKMLHVSRDLYDSDELRALRHFASQARSFVRERSSQSFLRSGMYAVKLKHVEEIKTHLESQLARLRELTEEFIAVKDVRQQEAKEKQGSLYRENDYPNAATIRAAVRWEWRTLSLDAPTTLRQISEDFFREEQAKARRQAEQIMQESVSATRAETLRLVESVLASLKPDEDGRAKAFKAPVVTKVTKFVELLRYQADDPERDTVVQEMQAALQGVDPKEIREDDAYRTALAGRFDRVRETLAVLVGQKPKRAIDLSDDDTETEADVDLPEVDLVE